MNVPEAEIRKIIRQHDIDDNGGIDFEEFKQIFMEKKGDDEIITEGAVTAGAEPAVKD